MIDGKNLFDQPAENEWKTYDNIWKATTGQKNDYTAGCSLDYPISKNIITLYRNKIK